MSVLLIRWLWLALAWFIAATLVVPAPAHAVSGDVEMEGSTTVAFHQSTGKKSLSGSVALDVAPRRIGGTFQVNIVPRARTTLRVGIGFGGSLESPDAYETEILLIALQRRFHDGAGEFIVGKEAYRLGRGRIGHLLSRGALPGYPSLAYKMNWGKARYIKVLGDLTVDSDYRRLGLHYLTFDVTPRLSLGAGEAYLRTANFGGDFFYDILPVLPYYLVKYFPGVPSNTDNNIVYLDAEYQADSWSAYGELMINEFPAVPGVSTNPALYGVLAGVESGPWIVEYARLSNYAYSNGNPGAAYVYSDQGLGHWLESDADTLDIRWRHDLTEDVRLTAGGFYRREGEGEIDGWFGSFDEAKENAFLSGVAETTLGLVVAFDYHADGWGAHAEVHAGPTWNDDHKQGERGFFYQFRYGLTFHAW